MHTNSPRPTKAEKLLSVLGDGKWHSTKELVRRVGHTFGGAKFQVVHFGYRIEAEPHPKKHRQWRYRLAGEPENNPNRQGR